MSETKKLTAKQVANLRKTARSIREHPKHYDQVTWRRGEGTLGTCGTAACVAGWAVHNDGWVPIDRYGVDGRVRRPRGKVEHAAPAVAARLLGQRPYSTGCDETSLFSASWLPKGLRWNYGQVALANAVANALERLADGASLGDVSMPAHRRLEITDRRLDAGLSR